MPSELQASLQVPRMCGTDAFDTLRIMQAEQQQAESETEQKTPEAKDAKKSKKR